jgi:hypothetical protein
MKTSYARLRTSGIRRSWAGLALVLVIIASVLPAPRVAAATFGSDIAVSTTADVISAADGLCSLREAVIAANTNAPSGSAVGECAAGSGADTIEVPAGDYILTRNDDGREDAGVTGDLDIWWSVSIRGQGKVSITGGPGFGDRILDVIAGAVSLRELTIRGGDARLDGGGIRNRAMLILDNVTLTGNRSAVRGGALSNSGVAQLTNVTVSGNRTAGSGGGLANSWGSIKLNNVTVAANAADDDHNGSGDGGGLAIINGAITAGNSILGDNVDGSATKQSPDCGGLILSQGYNLIENTQGCVIIGTVTGNITGRDAALGALADNGGQSDTHALLPTSPALDSANPLAPGSSVLACAATDQRNLPRPYGARCDMGAFEGQDRPQTGPEYEVIATIGVNDDLDDGACSFAHCSFREAILAANARPNDGALDAIYFDLLNPLGGQPAIQLGSPLPVITDPILIDGSTQPGGSPVLNGTDAGAGVDGIVIEGSGTIAALSGKGSGSTIRGLIVTGFTGSGIVINGSDGNLIESNSIFGNGGDGVRVMAGVSNSILNNAIYDNSGLGIDLAGDGRTPNDTGDLDDGANTFLNTPYLVRAVPGTDGVAVTGRHNGAPDTLLTIQFFESETCDPAEAGEGRTFLDQLEVTTDASGDVLFTPLLTGASGEGFITSAATDPLGNTSEFSNCVRVGLDNESWPEALDLILGGDPLSVAYQQYIDRQGQSRWYRFQVQPDSRIVVTLTDLPANYDLTLYKDIAAAFSDITSLSDLERLGAEFAPDAFSPDAFSPDAFSPDAFSPDAYSPDAFSPDAFSPDAYSPDAYSPDAFSPDAFSPDAYSPDAYSPDAYSPDAYSPDAYSPDAYSPDAFSPDAFSSAQSRSLIAVSAFGGTAGEGVSLNSHLSTGNYYVRVRGRNGAFDPDAAFTLGITMFGGLCADVTPITVPSSTTPVAGGHRTIVLADMARLHGSTEEKALLQARLAEFLARPEVSGVLVDVGTDARVQAANVQADAHPSCPYAKNQVAQAIRDIVQAYRSINPLEYVVIIGNDDVIPFFRHPDQALLASEKNYVPPVLDDTASQASLRQGYVLSQDAYGATLEIAVKDDAFPLPGLAVGRLVETAGEAAGMLAAYLGTDSGVTPAPQRILVTGYDFLEDAARDVQAELEAGTGIPAVTLIAPRDLSPQDPAAWTAEQLRTQMVDVRNDLAFVAGHFSASSALAADYTTRLTTSDLEASSADLTNAIFFSAGCHAGYNIVNSHGVPEVTQEPDWAQAFARKQATLIAGTGYQYGDTDFRKYSEELYYQFSRQLRMGDGPVAIGKALVAAKQAYLIRAPQLRGIDEKALLEATLFGLPMLSVNMPGARLTSDGDAPIVGAINPYATNPGSTLGLAFSDATLSPALTLLTKQLESVQDGGTVTTAYLQGSDGVTGGPTEPVLPLEIYNVSVPGTVLRGVGFRGGAYTDLMDVLPLVGAATTEVRGVHAPFLTDIFFPVRLLLTNYFDALADPAGGDTLLMLTPAQFRSSGPGSPTGTLRRYDRVDVRLFYSNNVAVYGGDSQPALAGAPAIVTVTTDVSGSQANVSVRTAGNPAAGIQQVWITYTATQGPLAGSWQSLDLAQSAVDSSLWTGVLDLGVTAPDDVRLMVQAVSGVGLVTLDANLGAYYVPGRSEQPTVPTQLTLDMSSSAGVYGSQVAIGAVLKTQDGAPLAGLPVTFGLGPQSRLGFTDGEGRAAATLSLLGIPGPNELTASFAGTTQYLASSQTVVFEIQRQSTQLTLDVAAVAEAAASNPLVSATLQDATGRRLGEKTVFFVLNHGGESYAASVITNYVGVATLPDMQLPAGEYQVSAYFSGVVPLPTATLQLADERYEPSVASGILTIIEKPSLSCEAAYPVPEFLWPPEKVFHSITIAGVTESGEDPATIIVTGIFQDEPVGSGLSSPDGRGVGTATAEVRAERDRYGNGRVYHIYFTAEDHTGDSCNGEVRVGVVKDPVKPLDPIDGGALYDSTIPG